MKITKVHQVGHPDFVRENPLLDLWQVPHSVEVWGPKSKIWLYKIGTPNPPQVIFWGYGYVAQLGGNNDQPFDGMGWPIRQTNIEEQTLLPLRT